MDPHPRNQITSPPQAPRAPPLPPLRRARDAASRFLGYPSQPNNNPTTTRNILIGRSATLGATQNATGSHRTGLEIATLAINERGSHALIGGKDIFKTIKIQDGHCTEDFNFRTAIRSTPTSASGQPRNTYSIDIADVAWAKGDCGDFVAAATSSGKIIVYDLGHAGLQAAQLHEHFRQVHKVTFNPHKGSLLLSGSQDGTVRLWDIRDVRNQASTLQSKRKYSGQSDGVRDVKWSPTEGYDFAFGTDAGEIQRWDMRNLKCPKVKVTAHNLACNAVDWHPDGIHILGCSTDRTVRVFDFSSTSHREPKWEIRTPFPVMNCRWRPSCESTALVDPGTRQCTQIVTSYDEKHAVVHIWDFRRPSIPFRELVPHHTAPTDLTWHSQDLLWTVGREGVFLQSDMQHAQKVVEKRNLQALDVSPLGEVGVVAQVRRRRGSRGMPVVQSGVSAGSLEGTSFLSRSWADDSLDHTFLAVVPSHREGRGSVSSRGTPMANSTSQNQSRKFTLGFDETMNHRVSFRPHQNACRGSFLSMNSPLYVEELARQSQTFFNPASSDEEFLSQVGKAFHTNATAALSIGAFDLSKTWKIAAISTLSHLKDRLHHHQTRNLSSSSPTPNTSHAAHTALESFAARLVLEKSKSPTHSPMSMYPISTLAQQLVVPESTSNVPTPLARPTTETENKPPKTLQAPQLLDVDNDEPIHLPPSLAPSAHPTLAPGSTSRQLTVGNLTSLQNLAANRQSSERENMERWWSSNPKAPSLSNVHNGSHAIQIPPPRLEKHDSDESFKFLEGSTDSRGPSFPASLASEGEGPGGMVAEHPSRVERRARTEEVLQGPFPTEQRRVSAAQSLLFDGSGTLGSSGDGKGNGEEVILASQYAAGHVWRDHGNHPDGTAAGHLGTNGIGNDAPPLAVLPALAPAPPTITGHPPPAPVPAPSHHHQTSGTTVSQPRPTNLSHPPSYPITHHLSSAPDLDLESHKPWTLISMLDALLKFYTLTSPHPQTASTLLLLLTPLLPRTHSLPNTHIYASVSAAVDAYLRLGFPQNVIPTLTADALLQPTKAGLNPFLIESVFAAWHDQCQRYQLLNDAVLLRKLCFPAWPAVYDDFLKDNAISLKCGACGTPLPLGLELNTTTLRCARCTSRQAPCPICLLPTSPFSHSPPPSDADPTPLTPPLTASPQTTTSTPLWSSCLLCNHAGHTPCYETWFVASRGASCPSPGCLCDCVSGTWRERKGLLVKAAGGYGLGRKEGSGSLPGLLVSEDGWAARESRAVEGVRGVLRGDVLINGGRRGSAV